MNKKTPLYLAIGILCGTGTGYAAVQELMPTLSPKLNLQIPVLYYDPLGNGELSPLWANLEYVPTSDGSIWFKVTDYDFLENDPNQSDTENGSDSGEPTELAGTIEAHNVWRQQVGVAGLTWSSEAATMAQGWANELKKQGCALEHNPDNDDFGENVYLSSGMNPTPKDVVDAWGSEISDYNYATNSCKKGKVCGHYTQIVWSSTTEVGCGKATCGREQVWVCNYNPPGNWIGEKPY